MFGIQLIRQDYFGLKQNHFHHREEEGHFHHREEEGHFHYYQHLRTGYKKPPMDQQGRLLYLFDLFQLLFENLLLYRTHTVNKEKKSSQVFGKKTSKLLESFYNSH